MIKMFCHQVTQFAPISVPEKESRKKVSDITNRQSLKNLRTELMCIPSTDHLVQIDRLQHMFSVKSTNADSKQYSGLCVL